MAMAAKFGNDDVAEVLVERGARVDAVDSRGMNWTIYLPWIRLFITNQECWFNCVFFR